MKRGFRCRKELLEMLKRSYDEIVLDRYEGKFSDALKNFDMLVEDSLRKILITFYPKERSRDQAWKTCKGSLYEYAVFRYIQNVIESNKELRDRMEVAMGDEIMMSYKDQLVIRNWNEIFPDADVLLIRKETNSVVAILSCKTSLRERLTETAFWKRELEKAKDSREIKLVFVTTDKDNELRVDVNRYILLHVIDYTFITDPNKYHELIRIYERRYGDRKDFDRLLEKVKPIDEIESFLKSISG